MKTPFPIIGLTGPAGSGKTTVAETLLNERHFALAAFADPIKVAVREWWGVPSAVLWGSSELRATPIEGVWKQTCPVPGCPERQGVVHLLLYDETIRCCPHHDHFPILVKTPLTAHEAAQYLRIEVERNLDENVCIRAMERRIAQLRKGVECRMMHGYSTPSRLCPGLREDGTMMPCMGFSGESDYCLGVVVPDVRFVDEAILLRRMGGRIIQVVPGKDWPDSARLPGSVAAHVSESWISPEYIDRTVTVPYIAHPEVRAKVLKQLAEELA